MRRSMWTLFAPMLLVCAPAVAACSNGDDSGGGSDGGDPAEIDVNAGLTGDPIKVGSIVEASNTPLANPDIPEGAQAAALLVNQKGGINGRPIEIVECDTENDPNAAAECGRRMVDEGVVALAGVLSAQDGEFMPLMEREQIPSIGHVPAGVPGFTSPASFPLSGGIVASAPSLAQGLAEQGATAIGLARPDLAVGAAIKGFIEPGTENEDIPITSDVAVPTASPDLAPYVTAALSGGADSIIVLLSGLDATNFIITARQEKPDILLATLSTDIQGLQNGLGSDIAGIVTTQSTTCPFETPACDQFDQALDDAGYDPDEASLSRISSYAGVITLAKIAESLPEVTAPAVFAALNEVDGLDIGIYPPIQFIEPAGELPRVFNLCAVPLQYDAEADTEPLTDTLTDAITDEPCDWTGDAVEFGPDSRPAPEE